MKTKTSQKSGYELNEILTKQMKPFGISTSKHNCFMKIIDKIPDQYPDFYNNLTVNHQVNENNCKKRKII